MSEVEKVRERFEQLKIKIISEHARLVKEIEEKARKIKERFKNETIED